MKQPATGVTQASLFVYCCTFPQYAACLGWHKKLIFRSPASVGVTHGCPPSGVHIDLKMDLHNRLHLSTPEELMRLSERDLQVSSLVVSRRSHIHRE